MTYYWRARAKIAMSSDFFGLVLLFSEKSKKVNIFFGDGLELAIHRKNVFHVEQLGHLAAVDIGIVASLGVDKSPRLCVHHAIGNATLLAKTLS